MSWLRRLVNTLPPGRLQRDIDRELAFHLAERADQLRAEGVERRGARGAAPASSSATRSCRRERTRDADIAALARRAAPQRPLCRARHCAARPASRLPSC